MMPGVVRRSPKDKLAASNFLRDFILVRSSWLLASPGMPDARCAGRIKVVQLESLYCKGERGQQGPKAQNTTVFGPTFFWALGSRGYRTKGLARIPWVGIR